MSYDPLSDPIDDNPPDPLENDSVQDAVLVREPFAEGQPAMALGNLERAEYIISETWVDLSCWPEFK